MADHPIEYSLTGRARDRIFWALRYGTAAEARETALRLRADLREESPRAAVFVGGRRIRGS